MTALYASNLLDERNGRPIEGASLWVYTSTGAEAALTDALDQPLTQPIKTGADGDFEYKAAEGTYRHDFWKNGVQIYRDNRVVVGTGGVIDVAVGLFGQDLVATGTAAAALGTLGLSASGGSSLIGFLQAGTGAVARTAQDKKREVVSIKDFGASPAASATANTTAITAALTYAGTKKCAVYVPAEATAYQVNNEFTVPDGVTVYGDGWGSFIQQTTLNKDVFIAGDSNTFRGLRLKVADGNDTDFVNCVYASSVNNLSVLDCFLEPGDLGGCGVHIRGVQNSVVRNNRIYGGKWTSGVSTAASAADILLYSFGSSERHVIDGNFCLSNNSQGIFVDALGNDGDIIVSNNTCTTLDTTTCTETGTWALATSGGVRRHGIVIGYNSSSVSGPRAVVTGNICRNTRWSGIYKQGVSSGAVTIANNLCDLNGYDTATTLSGGIYFNQSGHELVSGNYITNFQNTNTATAAITITAGTAPTTPCVIRGNFIRSSLGKGCLLTTNAALVELVGNTFVSNTGNDIDVSPNAASAVVAGHRIKDNRIVRTSGTAVAAITLDNQSSTRSMFVQGNSIRGFDNTTVSASNAAIRLAQAVDTVFVTDNEVQNYYYAFYCPAYYTGGRRPNVIYERNIIRDCNTGFVIAGTSANHTVPLVDNRFYNVTSQVSNAALGVTVGRIVQRLGDKFTWQTTAAPAAGSWDVGDQSTNTTPAVGQPKGWMCTVAGTPGTWVSTGNL